MTAALRTHQNDCPARRGTAGRLTSMPSVPPPLFATPTPKTERSAISAVAVSCTAFPLVPPSGVVRLNEIEPALLGVGVGLATERKSSCTAACQRLDVWDPEILSQLLAIGACGVCLIVQH